MADDIPDTGAVFTFGKSHFADNEPSHFFIKHDPVVAVSCGDEHSAVICQKGRVFVFGANSWGQLGLGHRDAVTRPSCVKWLKPHRALFVACGRAHTVFATDTNCVYSVGCNDEGQLGTGDLEHRAVPQLVGLDGEHRVAQVSAGSNHTALLTDEGRVFVCGSNSEGQLGLGEETRSCTKFTELSFVEKIAFVECGYYHTVFITSKGAVFITGDNENQKLGIPNTSSILYVPQVIPLNVEIKSACCGANHTFLLSMDESKIYAFGSNEKGQLGMPKDIVNVTEPTEINMEKMFEGYQLKLVACGAMHTAFVTDNGLLYMCGEARHNKLCLEEVDDADNANEPPNQYSPKRVTAMNGFVVDNVACGGCHTLLTATKGSNADFTNNDFSIVSEENRMSLPELPPLQKVPALKDIEDVTNANVVENKTKENGTDEIGSIDSLEANVSGSHIVNINDLEPDNASLHDVPNITNETIATIVENKFTEVTDMIKHEAMDFKQTVEDKVEKAKEEVQARAEVVDEMIKKTVESIVPGERCNEKKVLQIPDKLSEVTNSPPPKTPIIQDLLDIPDITHISPNLSKRSDDQKSEGGQSENETIPCASDKSSPQLGKTKTQAVIPIVRSDDHIEGQEDDVVINKLEEKGRFAKFFQAIKEKENSCIGKGKVIEEKVTENVHKGIDTAEESVQKVEERIETEIRNQTNSRTCTIL